MSSKSPSKTEKSVENDDKADGSNAGAGDVEIDQLRAQIVTLREENSRLRQEYSRARQSQHRRTAVGLATVGCLAIIAAGLFAEERTVLLALGATGLFGAILTAFLTPERFVPAAVGERVYGTFAENQERFLDALGLQEDRLYVPIEREESSSVRLFVPQQREYEIPDSDALERGFVLPDERRKRGVSVVPTGAALFDEFLSVFDDKSSDSPAILSQQVADALVETFEMADAISTDVTEGQLTASVRGSAYGDVDHFDHPIPSLFATALASQLSTPVEVEIRSDDDREDEFVVCRW